MQELYTETGEALCCQPWKDYPRPQLVREDWLCLNGEWQLTAGGVTAPIRVPFCPESLLSGWRRPISYGEEMTYCRSFTVPPEWNGRRILLHFGAVNRLAVVRVNGISVTLHENGYLPFSVDITDRLRPGENELTVIAVNDVSHRHPWGKQKIARGGMWYTPVSGIWQTVWLEPVPEEHIRSLRIRADERSAIVTVEGITEGIVSCGNLEYPLTNGTAIIEPTEPVLWRPENPYLYRFTVKAGKDRVSSYFALRTLSIREVGGVPRLCLNGKPFFFHGVLDQGYWSDGLYTPAAPDAYERDIAAMKDLGFNTLRKHIKIEPERFYYDCDRMGMIVFQDMVNCGEYHYLRDTVLPTFGFLRREDRRLNPDPEARQSFLRAMEETVDHLRNHPCICLWTVFNEGWGQFSSDEVCARLRELDDTRFIDGASGWFQQEDSDVDSLHIYFQKLRLGTRRKPQLLSEFGGWSYKLPEHSFNLKKTYGYRRYTDRERFLRDLRALYLEEVLPLVPKGLCGAIYTQVSDVEDETNGFLTYDRRVQKVYPDELSDVAAKLQNALSD